MVQTKEQENTYLEKSQLKILISIHLLSIKPESIRDSMKKRYLEPIHNITASPKNPRCWFYC